MKTTVSKLTPGRFKFLDESRDKFCLAKCLLWRDLKTWATNFGFIYFQKTSYFNQIPINIFNQQLFFKKLFLSPLPSSENSNKNGQIKGDDEKTATPLLCSTCRGADPLKGPSLLSHF